MLKGHVYLYQIFGNEICAKVFDTVSHSQNGILEGFGNEMEVTYSGSELSISSGVALIGGRPTQETSTSTIDAGTNSLYCKLVLTVDLDQENTTSNFNQAYYEVVTNASDYPTLTQDDIVDTVSGKYQFELAQFTTGISGIDNFVDKRTYVKLGNIINDINTLEDGNINAPSINAVKSYFNNETYYKVNDSLIMDGVTVLGYISNGAKNINFTVFTPKKMTNINTITVNNLNLAIRYCAGGYVVGGGVDFKPYVNYANKMTDNAFIIDIANSSGWGVTNNTPLAVSFINFKVTFS